MAEDIPSANHRMGCHVNPASKDPGGREFDVPPLRCLRLCDPCGGGTEPDVPVVREPQRRLGIHEHLLDHARSLIEVEVGDNVTLNLTSLDGVSHRWFVDYTNNSAADASVPRSPNFANQ